jgi:hypothetical protein
MMDRRRFLLTSLTGAIAGPLAAEGQQAGKVWRIGYVTFRCMTADIRADQPLMPGAQRRRQSGAESSI